MNAVITNMDDLIAALNRRRPRYVGIDGIDGSGKSTLSLPVAETLNATLIELDRYLRKNQGGYADHIDYSTLANQLTGTDAFILEGVCLLRVVERLALHLDCLIYVKRLNSYGSWIEEDQCEFPEGVEKAIQESRRNARLIRQWQASEEGHTDTSDGTNEPTLAEEIMRYHATYRPHAMADIIFCRTEE